MYDGLLEWSISDLASLLHISGEKCYVMIANNGYTALLPDRDKVEIFQEMRSSYCRC